MAELTVDGLGELTSPAANDEIGIWDVSAGQYLKIRRDTLVGGTITGGGTVATGGYTLTVPATGTVALRGADNSFSVVQTMQAGAQIGVAANLLHRPTAGVLRQKLESVAVADGGVVVANADSGYGIVFVMNATDGPLALFAVQGGAGSIIFGGSAYSGTKDNSGTVNVYAEAGQIKIQNRRGATKALQIWALL